MDIVSPGRNLNRLAGIGPAHHIAVVMAVRHEMHLAVALRVGAAIGDDIGHVGIGRACGRGTAQHQHDKSGQSDEFAHENPPPLAPSPNAGSRGEDNGVFSALRRAEAGGGVGKQEANGLGVLE